MALMNDKAVENTANVEIRTTAMPAEMQILLGDYPRDSWESHAGFKDKTRQWLGAHQMFRRISATVRKDTEHYLDGKKGPQEFISKLSYRGGTLVNNLHGHHFWEDNSYFPELFSAEPRLKDGLDILEKDHEVLHQVLDDFTNKANRVIKRIQLDNKHARDESGSLHTVATTIETLLQRHLGDEEELAVPIILHHRLRG